MSEFTCTWLDQTPVTDLLGTENNPVIGVLLAPIHIQGKAQPFTPQDNWSVDTD
jgi:hypothetical protein